MPQFISRINTREIFFGDQPFYQQPNYEAVKGAELTQKGTLPVCYSYETESKIVRIVKKIFSYFVFPIAIYHFFHTLIGRILVPSSTPTMLMGLPADYADQRRAFLAELTKQSDWKVKRITVEVDGSKLDAMVMGLGKTLANSKRWVLATGGNGEFYENILANHQFSSFLINLNANAIVFNYPGVGASDGGPNRYTMVKAYKAILKLLEDKEKGFGAQEIYSFGHSIGGGVQGDALKKCELKEGVRYVFIKHKTFSSMGKIAASITNMGFIKSLIKFFGWDFDSLESSRKLNVPEIIIQTSNENRLLIIERPEQVKHDNVITAETALVKELLDSPELIQHPEKKLFIGVPEDHNDIGILGHADFAERVLVLGAKRQA